MPMNTPGSKFKPEVKFQYGGRPFSETGSSINSAMHWDVLSKFGKQRLETFYSSLHSFDSVGLETNIGKSQGDWYTVQRFEAVAFDRRRVTASNQKFCVRPCT